ncbi:MAG TPA: phosphatidate cytidylyltransferase [Chthoniobacteraceae bacterium]|nr:phosphatidate cytidylyltransferase [Chthoniobacteraceae bacterium]
MQNIFSPTNSKRLTFFYRLSSTIALWTVALWIIFSGYEFGFFLLIGTIGMVALWEFYTMLDNKKLPNFKIIGMICGGIFICGSFYYFSRAGSMQSYDFEAAVLVVFMLVVFARQMFQLTRDISPLETMAFTLFGLLYVLWLFNFTTKIVYVAPRVDGRVAGQFYVLYLIVVTKFSDMGAYVTGSLFGKHLLIPHISPKKTWEGFFGALAFSLMGSYALRAIMSTKLALISYLDATALGLVLGFAAIIGDLAESIIKRSCDVKDSGHVLPGIGGTLDLIDSLLFTAPLLFFYMQLVMGVK